MRLGNQENIRLNKKLVRLSAVETFFIVGLGLVQYMVVKGFINNKK